MACFSWIRGRGDKHKSADGSDAESYTAVELYADFRIAPGAEV